MTEEINQVPGAEEGVSPSETPVSSSSGVSAPSSNVAETPAQQPSVDVEAIRAKYEQDINALKSSLQKRESQVTAEWQKRYQAIEKQLHETRMSSMTEEERKRYEAQLQTQEYQSLQSRLAEMEQERQLQASTLQAYQWFMEQGVPATAMNLTEGYEAVTQSGWEYLTGELKRLREAAANPPQPAKPALPELKSAPPVVTDKGTPATGTTWKSLRAQGWSDEAIYRAVESGRLPASIIPTE